MSRPVIVDSNDPEQVAAAQRVDEDRSKDIEFILSQPRGRRWLYDFIHETCHVRLLSFVPGAADTSAFNEGGRAIGEAVLDKVRAASPKLYFKMLEENLE